MQVIVEWYAGHLSSSARIWTAMAPGLVICAYFILGLLIYLVRCAIKGPYRDPEFEARKTSVLANLWFRLYFIWLMQPLWRLVLRTGVPPTAVTTLSVLFALASGISLAAGRFALGGWLYIFSGVLDILDGRLARATNRVTKGGGALDSILDRYADSAVLAGLAWYYRDSRVLIVALVALIGSSLVPYIRARGEAAGLAVKDVGMMQRAERIIYIGIACALSPVIEVMFRDPNDPRPLHLLAVCGLFLLAIGTQLTAMHRLVYVVSGLNNRVPFSWLTWENPQVRRRISAHALATTVDFICMWLLVIFADRSPAWATVLGCVVGGAVNLSINMFWTFASRADAKLPQLRRYAFVSFTSAALNGAGVWVMLQLPDVDFRIAWLFVRVAVAFAWNYPLQRDYVFASLGPQKKLASL
jgi:phosphatidylglycerophosphate synthase/putative flippase GtrA